jgi:hypothetical protein
MYLKWARVFAIIAFIVSLSWVAEAATGGPVFHDVSAAGFAASAGFIILRLVSMLRGR